MRPTVSVSIAALLFAACGGEKTTGPAGTTAPPPKPVASVQVTPSTHTLTALGATQQFQAVAKNADGTTVSGKTFTWASSATNVATIDAPTGVAVAVTNGSTTITATTDGVSGTASLTVAQTSTALMMRTQPTGAAPRQPFATQPVLEVHDANANVAENDNSTVVTAAIASGGGTLLGTTTATAASGVVTFADLAISGTAGDRTLTFTAQGLMAVTSGSFAIAPFVVTGTSVPLVEGQMAVVTGQGFDPSPANNIVTVDGTQATVAAATSTQLDIVVPTFDCQPARTVAVVVTVGGETAPALSVGLNPASFLTVGVGEQLLITDPASFCLQFVASTASEAYLIGVQSASEVASSLTDVQLVAAKDPAAPAPPPAPLTAPAAQGFPRDLVMTDRMRRWGAHRQAEVSLRSRQLAWLNNARGGLEMASGAGAIPPTAMVGDMLPVNVQDINSTNLCLNFTTITAEVKHIGTKGVWLEDIANPGGGFSAADYQSLSDQLDNTIFDTDVAQFGNPTDFDANGKIGIVVTKEVNKLSASLLGFVWAGNLFSVASCTSSNVGELYYGKAPDPVGSFGAAYSLVDALDDAPTLIAHEFVHIIQGGVRLTAGAPFLSQWETEGQATLGEEVVGHAMEGNSAGQNYGNTVAIDPGPVTGLRWYVAPFLDMAQYFGWNSDVAGFMTKVSNAPQQCTWLNSNPVSDGSDLNRPCVGGRQPYGVPWSFLRWLNDHFAASFPGGEQGIQRAIVSGSSSGFANISSVIGEPISILLAQWAATFYVDDRVIGAATRLTMPSWNLFDIYEVRLAQGLRLVPTEVSFVDFTQTFQVRGASTGYFRISGTTRPATAIRARDLANGTLPSSMQLWVVRLQ